MALDRTSGFDMLIQVSEAEINNQVAAAFASGLLFPANMVVPFNSFGASGSANLNFRTPVVDLDRTRPQIGLTVDFAESQLDITNPIPINIPNLAGTIVVVDAVQIRSGAGTQQAVIDFTAGAPTVTVTFTAATAATLGPLLAAAGITVAMAQNQVANTVRDQLVTGIQRLPLTPPIPVADDSDPLTPFNFDVTTVNDASAADRDALTFGVRTSSESGGNINNVTQSFIPNGSTSLVMMSNFWLLARVIRPQLAAALGRPITDFDTPLRLNRSVPIPGQDATLTNLEARIDGNRIRVDGRATASDTGWSAVATFHFFISLTLQGGQMVIQATEPTIDVDVDLDWWVWLLGLGLGALFGGAVGAIIAAIVLAIVEAVAEGLVENMATDAFNNVAGAIPPIPLGPIGAGLALTAVILDDLEMRGSIIRSFGMPIKNTGSHESLAGFTIDLDTGQVRAVDDVRFGTDLIASLTAGIDTNTGSGLTVTGASYGSLTPVQLEKMSFAGHHINAAQIPISIDLPFFDIHNEIVFGVLTNEGRLAKVRAWRAAMSGGALHVSWTTFDRPTPSLDIAMRCDVLEEGDGTPYIDGQLRPCSRFEVSRRCTFEAWPKLMSFPIDYRWCLCGTVLEEGSGEVQTASGPVEYELDGRRLELTYGMGQKSDCELCVSAIDARGRELFTCVQLKHNGTETRCGKPKRFYPKPNLEIIPCDPLRAIDRYESVISERVQKQIVASLNGKQIEGKQIEGKEIGGKDIGGRNIATKG